MSPACFNPPWAHSCPSSTTLCAADTMTSSEQQSLYSWSGHSSCFFPRQRLGSITLPQLGAPRVSQAGAVLPSYQELPALSWLSLHLRALTWHPLVPPHFPCPVQADATMLSAPSGGQRSHHQSRVLGASHIAGALGEGQRWGWGWGCICEDPTHLGPLAGCVLHLSYPLSPASAFTTCFVLPLAQNSLRRF